MPTAPTTTGRRSRSCSVLSAAEDAQAPTHASGHRPYRRGSELGRQPASRGPALRRDGSRSRLGHRGRSGATEALRPRNRQDGVGGAVRLAGVRGEAPEIGTTGVRRLRPQRGGVDLARGDHPGNDLIAAGFGCLLISRWLVEPRTWAEITRRLAAPRT